MAAVEFLACRRDDRLGKLLIVAHSVRQAHAVHLALALLVEREDRGAGGSGQIAAHDDLDRQDVEALADDDVRIGIGDDVVGADILGRLEPVARRLGEDLALVGDAGQDPVKRAQPVGADDDAAAIGKVVIFAYLAAVVIRQFREMGF